MGRDITLTQYLVLKDKKVLQLFIFLLGNEYSYLSNETTWLHTVQVPTHLVRMTEDEFHSMDFAVHPKIMCTRSGKELFDINGIPNVKYLQHKISQI